MESSIKKAEEQAVANFRHRRLWVVNVSILSQKSPKMRIFIPKFCIFKTKLEKNFLKSIFSDWTKFRRAKCSTMPLTTSNAITDLDLLFGADDNLMSSSHINVLCASQLAGQCTAQWLHCSINHCYWHHGCTMLQLDLLRCTGNNIDNEVCRTVSNYKKKEKKEDSA